MNKWSSKYGFIAFVIALSSGAAPVVSAAPGVISQAPLFVRTAVQPNILFVVDDSGSMDWEVLKTNGGLIAHPGAPNSGNLDMSPNDFDEDREHCAGYNAMAYNPAVTYLPWTGEDNLGNPYQDQSITSARIDPFNPGAGTVNLLSVDGTGLPTVYGVWTDDGDGVYEAGECPVGTNNGGGYTSRSFAGAGWVLVSAAGVNQTNYANWFSYYRKREYVAKRALSDIISSSSSRVGLATLHNNNSVGTPIADVDDISAPLNVAAQTNKSSLMDNLFSINSTGGTPLRQSLEDAGSYYRGNGSGGLFNTNQSTSPILPATLGGMCQQNFTVLMSDGFWNGGAPNVGNADGDNDTIFDGGVYADGVSNTLADVAMEYYENDLAPGIADNVPESNLDNNGDAISGNMHQHMVTYTVAFGVNGTLDPDVADPNAGGFTWPTPVAGNLTTVDDMWHAAYNSRGLFLNAGDPSDLISRFNAAIADIAARAGTASAVSFNSTSLESNTAVYQAVFDSAGWHGNLKSFLISNAGLGVERWGAASGKGTGPKLDDRNLTPNTSTRDVITYNGTQGIPFQWPVDHTNPNATTELSVAQINDLLTNSAGRAAGTTVAQYGAALVNYLRGDFSNEVPNGQQFRDRQGHRLGDIVHSSPIFVGPPSATYPDSLEVTPYSTFKTNNANRTGVVYVGANDGMLHAFRDSDGEELLAYVPGAIASANFGEGMHYLAEQTYAHRYYVDLSPSVADVFIGGNWRTVLVGGLRGGGKSIFALDITNPAKLNESVADAKDLVMWEFSDPDLGFTFSEVQIARMHNGKWAAIIGNGYNAETLTSTGRAKLFIVYLDGTPPTVIDTGEGSIANANCSDPGSDCNGLSTPAVADLNGDAIIDRVYAGDLQGNMWAFDVSDSNPINWGIAHSNGSGTSPLFQACNASPCTSAGKSMNRQPITTKPVLTLHPSKRTQSTEPNVLVMFGTGQYLTSTDNTSTDMQTTYGVWDGGDFGLVNSPVPLGPDDLVGQTISVDVNGFRQLTDNKVNYSPISVTAEYGWKINLPTSKERVIVNSTLFGDILLFNTFIPSTDVCSEGGSGWEMFVDIENGGLPDFALLDINNDGIYDTSDIIAGRQSSGLITTTKIIGNQKVNTSDGNGNGNGGVNSEGIAPGQSGAHRISWTHLEQ